MRSRSFRKALDRAARIIAIGDPPIWERSPQDELFDFAITGDALNGIEVATTAKAWAAQLAWAVDANATMMRFGYFDGISIKMFEHRDSSGQDLVAPPVPVYLAMLRDLAQSVGLSENSPSGTLQLALRGNLRSFGCLLEPCEAIWISVEE